MALESLQDTDEDIGTDQPAGPSTIQSQRAAPFYGAARGALNEANLAKSDMDTARTAMLTQMQRAGENLRNMQFGPSDAEQNMRIASAWTTPTRSGRGTDALSGVYSAEAQNMQMQREADLYKQQLMSQYGMAPAQLAYSQAEQRYKNAAEMVRGAGMFAGRQYGQEATQANKGLEMTADGGMQFRVMPGGLTLQEATAEAKLHGMTLKGVLPDGTYKFGRADVMTNTPPLAGPQTTTQQAPRPPGSAGPAGNQQPQAATGAVQGPAGSTGNNVYRSAYTPDNMPYVQGTVFNSPTFEPIFEKAAEQAFDPRNIPHSLTNTGGMGYGVSNDARIAARANEKFVEEEQKRVGPVVEAATNNLATANKMMSLLESDQGVKTGVWSETMNQVKAALLQLDILDPTQKALLEQVGTQQEFNKFARQLAASGLKTTYGGRITNMELQQALKSNPNADLLEIASRSLLKSEIMKDEAILHENAFRNEYFRIPGADPRSFKQGWYDKFLNPFTDSAFSKMAGNHDFYLETMRNQHGYTGLPSKNAKGWPLVQDAKGIQAYMNPANTQEFEQQKIF